MTSSINCFGLLLGGSLTGGMAAVFIILALIVGIGGGIALGWYLYRQYARKNVGSARQEADKIIADAHNEAKTQLKEAMLEAKEENAKLRSEFEQESRE